MLVGDPDQLPSVGAGNVFGDLIRSERVATVALKDIFRQAEQSAIVRSAHLVNEGRLPELQNTAASDFFFLPRRDSVRLVDTVVEPVSYTHLDVYKRQAKHLPIFFGTGVVSMVFFTLCYFKCQELCSLAVSAILLYTAPAMVCLLYTSRCV